MMPFILLSYALLNGKKATDVVFVFLNIWACGVNLLMGYRYQVLGKHLVKKNQAYIFVVNHSSYLDSLAVVRVIPQSFKPLGKVEMVKIPIFGMIYKKLVVLIDRSSRESREKCVKDLKVEIARGQIYSYFSGRNHEYNRPIIGRFL
jgi:1-acyl-sn-glycerol-3-phosphate acyltransferase